MKHKKDNTKLTPEQKQAIKQMDWDKQVKVTIGVVPLVIKPKK